MSDSSSATLTLHGTPVVPGRRLRSGPGGPRRGVAGGDRPLRRVGVRRGRRAGGVRRRGRRRGGGLRAPGRQGLGRRRRGARPRAPDSPATRVCAPPSASTSRRATTCSRRCMPAVEQFVQVFTSMGGLMAERVTDLRDIERRVVAHLVGEPEPGVQMPETPAVLVAEDLAPSDTATLDPKVVLALVTERGGPTSHTAIIARQLAIPCVVGTAGAMTLVAGTPLLVDGVAGTIESSPDPDEAAAPASRPIGSQREALATWTGPGETADGTRVKILANVADGESARAAAVGTGGGRRAVPDRALLPQPGRRAVRRGAGLDLRRGARAVRRPVRRGPHPRRGLRQAGRLRDARGRGEPRARRPRAAARRSTTRTCWRVSSTASRPPRARPAPRPG